MLSWIRVSSVVIFLSALAVVRAPAQNNEQLEVSPPPLHRAEAPAPGATREQLEQRGDELRMEKAFLDAIDYYRAAQKGSPGNASLFNKIGMCQLQMHRDKEAKKSFELSIKADHNHADAYNNLGATYYDMHNNNAAIKQYQRAISLNDDAASYYLNLGTAYFGKKRFEPAIQSYAKAVALDPEIFDHNSRGGLQAKMASPEDRAHYDYVLAKLYAKSGVPDRSLHYLKKAMEEGYKNINDVYKDNEFTALRKDPRFAELMAAKTLAIPN